MANETTAKTGKMTLVMAIREHLSLPGEGAGALMQQIKALTEQDKQDLTNEFGKIGVEIVAPTK